MATAASAQSAAEKNANAVIASILTNPAIKSWTPSLFASSATAARLSLVAGIKVQVDPSLPEDTLVVRNNEPFQINPGSPNAESIKAGQDMAIYRWGNQ
jgi:hypothetical protein